MSFSRYHQSIVKFFLLWYSLVLTRGRVGGFTELKLWWLLWLWLLRCLRCLISLRLRLLLLDEDVVSS